MKRFRRWTSVVLLAILAVIFPLGVVAMWAGGTIYDSNAFSQRSVELLNSPSVRRLLATRLTEQLARSGNQQAVAFRPAVQLAIEAVIDTDTFRSIFRTAILRTHQALLEGRSGDAGLDLSDSVSIIAASLQLPASATPGQATNTFGQSLADITKKAGQLHLWDLDDIVDAIALIGLAGGALLAALSIALSLDRRRTVARLGWVVLIDGIVIVLLVQAVQWYAGRVIHDGDLANAVQGALARGMADLNTAGLWIMGYGIVIAAAAGAIGGDRTRRLTPSEVRTRFSAWMQRRRATTGGTVLLGLLGLFVGLIFIQEPLGNLELVVVIFGLWLTYLSVLELVGLIHRRATAALSPTTERSARQRHVRHLAALGVVALVLVGLLTFGLVATTRRAAQRANAQVAEKCNGDTALCDLPLDMVMFPGTHNSMSSALYPGWLFAEQVNTIKDQLNAGVRALLVDTYYGVPSSSRLPGSETPIVLTDRATSLTHPVGEETLDPTVVARANQLAANSPKAANGKRSIYLCHNYCELGAYPFASAMTDVKNFLDANPNEVVILDIQDTTSPADTAAAIVAAGLGDRVATLTPGQPLPTLGELIQADKRLLVFAEEGGPGAPAWYHQTYQWFQETPYTFKSVDDFNCSPNRGLASAPLLLVNHWVSEGGLADPAAAAKANQRSVLQSRLQGCLEQRNLIPNVVAVDFAGRGDLVSTVKALNQQLLKLYRRIVKGGEEASSTTTPSGTAPGSTAGASSSPTTASTPSTPSTVTTVTTATTLPPPEPPTTVPPITTLTGGDPATFCAAVASNYATLYGWAVAGSTEPPSQAGEADLAFAPVVDRALTELLASAPVEVAARTGPVLARAKAAEEVLRTLGLDDAALAAQADLAAQRLSAVTGLDAVSVEEELLSAVTARSSPPAVVEAAKAFSVAHPVTPGLYDLGTVSDAVAEASGYGCLAGLGSSSTTS